MAKICSTRKARHYLNLEEDFRETAKYVEFNKDNFKTYSLKYLELFEAVCSEIDVVGKAMASEIYNVQKTKFDPKEANIQKWWFPIQYNYQMNAVGKNTQLSIKTVIFNNEYELHPWENFEIEHCKSNGNNKTSKKYMRLKQDGSGKLLASTPSWWGTYNDVKHQRTTEIEGSSKINFSKANLGNLINAFAALYILEWSYIYEIGDLSEYSSLTESQLFGD